MSEELIRTEEGTQTNFHFVNQYGKPERFAEYVHPRIDGDGKRHDGQFRLLAVVMGLDDLHEVQKAVRRTLQIAAVIDQVSPPTDPDGPCPLHDVKMDAGRCPECEAVRAEA